MVSILLAALLAAQGRNAPTLPPPVVSVPSPPPVVAIGSVPPIEFAPRYHGADPQVPRPFLVDTSITVGDQTLYRDVLRVARGYDASYTESASQAPMVPCPGAPSYQASQRSSLRVQLSAYSETADRITVSVNWERPLPPSAVCQPPGLRGVQLTNVIELKPGDTVVLEGDAGLRVTLKRR